MPQTNKSASGGSLLGQVSAPDQGEPPPQEVRTQVAAGEEGGAAAENQGDPEIIKSPSDPKKYRYIELSNGLRALLISDFSGTDGKGDSENREDKGDTEDREEEEEEEREEEGDSGEGSEEDEEEDEEEEQDSDFDELEDENTGKKKRGSSEKQAAAALCISVGSFSDPDDLPGLAHFLEHMVFMGSEKYPAENGFDAFLKKHGGSDNASTDCERTIFQFDVQRKYFREALDRWAQFFICPLMIEDAIDREVEAVDSEYQLARPSDSHRKEMLFGSLAKPGHPMSKFCWGNAQTLKHEPREKQINTYERLRHFWRRYYSAHYMTLAIQSKETLDTLEQWVREIFINVPNNGEPRADFSHLQQPFDTPAFNKLYRVVPVRKVHALTISWAVPPQGKHYRVKPLHYISWLIGHEGTGSILSLLRRKCWALALFGGNSETGFDQNTTYSIFSISITLTDQGYQNFYQVVHLVFQYLKMLQTLGPQQRIYEEIQKIEANEFHYQEQTDPIEFVENICENMQLFPKGDFLTGDQLMFEYDPQVISAALSLLTPDRANLLLLSPENEGHCPLREKWFGTCYSMEDISEEWAQRWTGDFDLHPELHLPAENKFIASDFTLKTSDCPDSEFPVRIVNSERGCLWYKKDNKFKIPKEIQGMSEEESDGGEISDVDWSEEDESSDSEPEPPRPKKSKKFVPAAPSVGVSIPARPDALPTAAVRSCAEVTLVCERAHAWSPGRTVTEPTPSPEAPSPDTVLSTCEQGKDGTTWITIQPGGHLRRQQSQNVLTESAGPTAHARRNIEDALSAFLCLVDEQMLQHIRDCTVTEAHHIEDNSSWDLSVAELKAFIALLYVRGAYNKNIELESFWSEEWGLAFFRATMPRNRFREIMRYLRFDKKQDRRARLCSDKFALVSDVWGGFVNNSIACYKPGPCITVDEQLFPTKARCRFTQYMAHKPDKFGIKFWLAADVETKYLLNGFPYLGKDETPQAHQRLGESVVMKLVEPYVGEGRNVTTDDFFTSLSLAKKLLQKNTSLVGTVNKSKQELPPLVQEQKGELFSTKVLQHKQATLTVYQEKPRRSIALLSTMHPTVCIGSGKKRKPETVTFYNTTKVGVAVLDQMARQYTVNGATRRWPVAVFYNLLDMAAINAHVLLKACTSATIPRRAFILQLAKELREEHLCVKASLMSMSMEPQPTQEPKRRQCQVNTRCKQNKTMVCCKGCQRPVCGKCTARVESFCPRCMS